MTEHQFKCYAELSALIKIDPEKEELQLQMLSNNHIMRFLAGNGFEVTKSLEEIKKAENFLLDNKMWEIKDSSECKEVLDMKAFVNMKNDYVGRPNLMFISHRFLPKNVEPIDIQRYGVCLIDYMFANAPSHVDSMNFIMDARDVGNDQLHMESIKGMIHIASVYTERVYKIYVVEASFSLKLFFKIIYPFMPEKTKGKIQFVSMEEIRNILKMAPEDLPKELGGTGYNYLQLFDDIKF